MTSHFRTCVHTCMHAYIHVCVHAYLGKGEQEGEIAVDSILLLQDPTGTHNT